MSPPIPLPAPVSADFADWLSPMLVKELRQGVRTRVFVLMFIFLQVFMLMDLVLSLLVASSGLSTSEGSYFFWFMVAVPTLLVIPMSGLNAIGSEIRGNTLELIFLTRLTAFRIVVGKWFALFTQSLLLICAVLPYLVLRYFMGGVNLAGELLLLGAMLIGSALLIAVATGLSAFPTRIIRPLAMVGGVIAFFAGIQFFFGFFRYGRSYASLPDGVAILTALTCSVIVILLMLDVGAARIAPPAENHSAAMRFLACAGLLLAGAAQAYSLRFIGVASGAFVVAVIVCTVAVCEQPRAIPSLYRPFARWGWPGRVVGRFFYPGWHTGILFTLAIFAAFGGLFYDADRIRNDEAIARYVALLGTLLMPVALIRTVFRRFSRPIGLFFSVQALSLAAFIFCAVCDGTLKTGLKNFLPVLPFCALIGPWSDPNWNTVHWMLPVCVVTGLSVVTVAIAALPAFVQTRRLERESLDLPMPPKLDAPRSTPPAPPHAPLA